MGFLGKDSSHQFWQKKYIQDTLLLSRALVCASGVLCLIPDRLCDLIIIFIYLENKIRPSGLEMVPNRHSNDIYSLCVILSVVIGMMWLIREFFFWFFKGPVLSKKLDTIIQQNQKLQDKLAIF